RRGADRGELEALVASAASNALALGQVPEVAGGDPPHLPGGSVAHAWSVAELLRALSWDLEGKGPAWRAPSCPRLGQDQRSRRLSSSRTSAGRVSSVRILLPGRHLGLVLRHVEPPLPSAPRPASAPAARSSRCDLRWSRRRTSACTSGESERM